MDKSGTTIGDIFVTGKISTNIRDALKECMQDHGFSDARVSALSLLAVAGRPELIDSADARALVSRLLGNRLQSKDVTERFRGTEKGKASWLLSPGLAQAFTETHALRARVGGQDEYIGMRHLFFTLLSATEPPLRPEMDDLLKTLGLSRTPLLRESANYLLQHREEHESDGIWLDIFAERGVPWERKVATAGPDDPWREKIKDCSGATIEAEAFARMILADSFDPPLAFGIFGDWGAGKSFFLRLVFEQVELIKQQEEKRRPKTGKSRRTPVEAEPQVKFLTRAAQIRFNAWHYAETNLWASLVTQIFKGLDSSASEIIPDAAEVIERLSSARTLSIGAAEELIARRAELVQARQEYDESQEALSEARKSSANQEKALISTAWAKAVEAGGGEQDLRASIGVLGFDAAGRSVEDLGLVVAELKEEVLGRSAWAGMFHTATRLPFVLIFLLAVGISLGAAVALSQLGADGLVQALTTIGGLVTSVTGAIAIAAGKARGAINSLRTFRLTFEQKLEQQVSEEKRKAGEAEADLAAKTEAARAAEANLEAVRERVDAVASEYESKIGEARVRDFVRGRIASGEYSGQLGFIATVRKDFEELSLLMRPRTEMEKKKARKVLGEHRKSVEKLIAGAGTGLTEAEKKRLLESAHPPDETKGLDRVILYIDDLDRCTTQKVVEVLQAVHLLLAFPLFVVFVAVDVRWLRYALETQYAGQIGSGVGGATAGDYLEKIIQVPYWVRPLAGPSTEALLKAHIQEDLEREQASESAAPEGSGPATGEDTADGAAPSGQGETASAAAAATRAEGTARLRIKLEEAEFIGTMGQYLDGSPRRTLRFVNTYRLIKASLNAGELAQLDRGGYRELLVLLAVSIAADSVFPIIAHQLRADVPFSKWLGEAEKRVGVSSAEVKIAKQALAALGTQRNIAKLKTYGALVERFGFGPSIEDLPPEKEKAPKPSRVAANP